MHWQTLKLHTIYTFLLHQFLGNLTQFWATEYGLYLKKNFFSFLQVKQNKWISIPITINDLLHCHTFISRRYYLGGFHYRIFSHHCFSSSRFNLKEYTFHSDDSHTPHFYVNIFCIFPPKISSCFFLIVSFFPFSSRLYSNGFRKIQNHAFNGTRLDSL